MNTINNPTVISFFTDNWDYPKHAANLIEDCNRLGLSCVIERRDSTNSYVGNCNIKPFFILEKLEELKSPVVWMDADGTISSWPHELSKPDLLGYHVAGFQSQRDNSRIHVATVWFNYDAVTIDLIKRWQQISVTFLDDGAFQVALDEFKDKVRMKILPSEYFKILKRPMDKFPEEGGFVHRLSSSDLKWEYKNRVERR